MFDPRMMSPDGSSYSRQNALAGVPQFAATSGMAPTGVQTLGAQPNALAGMAGPRGSQGWRDGLAPGQMQDMRGDWRTAMQDWRGMRPQMQGGPRPPDWRQQFQDWRGTRPDRQTFFQNFPGA